MFRGQRVKENVAVNKEYSEENLLVKKTFSIFIVRLLYFIFLIVTDISPVLKVRILFVIEK